MLDQNFLLPRIEMSNDYIVDFVSFLIPCQRFRIRAIIMKDAQTSLAIEFALRFLDTIGKTTIENFANFFGFSPSEVRVLTADLIRSGFVHNCEGFIELTREGQALFADGKNINLIKYDDFNSIVSFDLIAFCLAEELSAIPNHFKALEELPIQNRERASQAYKIVREEVFEKHFHEYCQQYKGKKHNEHMQLHSIVEVEPKARFNTELVIPIQLSLEGPPQVKPNFSTLIEKGRWESRRPLIATVNQKLASVKATEDSQAAIEFIAKFDKGLLSGDPSSEDFNPIRWIQQTLSGRILQNNYTSYLPLVGSSSTQQVRKAISEWTQALDFPTREEDIPLLWIKPSVSHWGRNADFFGLLSDLANRYAEEGGLVLIASSDNPQRDARDLKKWFGPRKKEELSFFRAGICLHSNSLVGGPLPHALELIVDPGRWILVLLYLPITMPQTGTQFPVAIGFCTANSQIVQGAQLSLEKAVLPSLSDAHIMWKMFSEEDNLTLAAIKSAFLFSREGAENKYIFDTNAPE